ncbi:MAG: thioredoxin family protein, partial [Dolichospermum sp.]|nr:thioredoxin family protein [Dolichospermum sp.]
MKLTNLQIPFILIFASFIFSPAGYSQNPASKISKLSEEVTKLRTQGQTGLQTFLKSHIHNLTSPPEPQIKTALDQLCQQRDCYASKLYWYTDLEQAKTAAKISGKPILSLRLLGRLDTDLSCANSRFFRVALYPNAEISQELRDKFILHWQTVRPVPKITIDFGDGRKLERTITGNSIHYILDSSGRPIDAIPGLYGPKAFLKQLQQGEVIAKILSNQNGEKYNLLLQQYHLRRLDQIQNQWRTDLSKLGIQSPPRLVESPNNSTSPPSARLASSLAVSKAVVEIPILNSIEPETAENASEILDKAT